MDATAAMRRWCWRCWLRDWMRWLWRLASDRMRRVWRLTSRRQSLIRLWWLDRCPHPAVTYEPRDHPDFPRGADAKARISRTASTRKSLVRTGTTAGKSLVRTRATAGKSLVRVRRIVDRQRREAATAGKSLVRMTTLARKSV